MNERIRELAEQAGYSPDMFGVGHWDMPECKKFAELIVRECAKSANDWYLNHDKIHSDPMSYVLAHFGVDQ